MDQLTPQELFDSRYISSTEICKRLGIDRTNLLYRRRQGQLPGEITIVGLNGLLWERSFIESFLVHIEQARQLRRDKQAGTQTA